MAPLIVFTFLLSACLGRVNLLGDHPVTCLGQVRFLGRQLCCAHSFSSTCLLSLSGRGGFLCGPTLTPFSPQTIYGWGSQCLLNGSALPGMLSAPCWACVSLASGLVSHMVWDAPPSGLVSQLFWDAVSASLAFSPVWDAVAASVCCCLPTCVLRCLSDCLGLIFRVCAI